MPHSRHLLGRRRRPARCEARWPAGRPTRWKTRWKIVSLPLLVLALCTACSGIAHTSPTTVYVDSHEGDDANPGTSPGAPIRTIARVNRMVLSPGDSVLFRRGQTWREQLVVPSSGEAGSPITFAAYGEGAAPVISGAEVVNARWQRHAGKVYAAVLPGKITPAYVYVNGEHYDLARYPQSGFMSGRSTPADSKRTITADGLDAPAGDVVGAQIMVKTQAWHIGPPLEVVSFDPSARMLTADKDFAFPMKPGFGFYLQNKLWMLDSPKEWYFDAGDATLYLQTADGGSPEGRTVEVSVRPYGILIKDKRFITIRNVRIEKTAGANIQFTGGDHITIDEAEVVDGTVGIRIGAPWSSVTNSTITAAATQGVETTANGLHDIDLLNNRFSNVGNVGRSPVLTRASAQIRADSVRIQGNTVLDTGYLGIRAEGKDVLIEGNTVDRGCLVLDDCGGIYVWGAGLRLENFVIKNNTVKNMIGTTEGTPDKTTSTRGIYLDTCAYNVTVTGNVVVNADYGIHLHNGRDNVVTGNQFFARRSAIIVNENPINCGLASNNTVTKNTFAVTGGDAPVTTRSFLSLSTANFGKFDDNRFCLTGSQAAVVDQGIRYSLKDWQQARGQEMRSTTAADCTPAR